jgi:hypothetical protein
MSEEDQWLDILRNGKFPIEHGYYMTKQLSTKDRKKNMTWEEGAGTRTRILQVAIALVQ